MLRRGGSQNRAGALMAEALFDDDVGVNDLFFDATMRHQIYLLRYAGGLRNRIIELLNETEPVIRDIILAGMVGVVDARTNRVRQRRAHQLVERILVHRGQAFDDVQRYVLGELAALASSEARFLVEALEGILPTELDIKPPATLTGVAATTYQGKTSRQWLSNIRAADRNAVSTGILIAARQNDTPRNAAARLLGTAAVVGRDGLFQSTRHHFQGFTRTSVNAVANEVKSRLFLANP